MIYLYRILHWKKYRVFFENRYLLTKEEYFNNNQSLFSKEDCVIYSKIKYSNSA